MQATRVGVYCSWYPHRWIEPFEAMIRRVASAGFEAIALEHYFRMLHLGDRVGLRTLRAGLRDSGLAFEGMHAPVDHLYGLWWDLSGAETIRRRSLETCCRLLDALAYLGGSYLVVHQGKWGFPVEEYRPRLERSLKSLQALVAHGQEVGVEVCLENVFGVLNRMFVEAQGRGLLPGVKVCLDTGHAQVANRDPARLMGTLKLPPATVHLHDNHGRRDEHLIPGDGTIDWARFMPILAEAGYAGNLMVEAFPFRYPPGIDAWLALCLAAAKDLRSRALRS